MRRHRKLRGKKLKKQRGIIIASLIGITFLMTAGYAAFSTNITLNAKGNIKKSPVAINGRVTELLKPENIEESSSTVSGLYVDTNESDSNGNNITRYIYKGISPYNYIHIKEDGINIKYRIYSIESDGTIKVIRDENLAARPFDTANSNRRQTGYCSMLPYCNAWAAMDSFTNGTLTGKVEGLTGNTGDSSIKEYIDTTYKSLLNDYDKIVTKTWNISGTTTRETLADTIADENQTTWDGEIALLTASEYVRANSNTTTCGTMRLTSTCKDTNYLNIFTDWWLLTPSYSSPINLYVVNSNGYFSSTSASLGFGVRPSFYLCSGLTLTGEGTYEKPYEISGSCTP